MIQEIDACCPSPLVRPMSGEDAAQVAGWLGVLADPARLRLVSLIAAMPEREACGCDLTSPLGLSQPTVSHHLKVLQDAGIVAREQRGRWAFYQLRTEPLAALGRALMPAEVPA
ncbi:MAG TPA: metalloregulator ArsR/SmtB family transcription factor [Actinomycetota bacterium]